MNDNHIDWGEDREDRHQVGGDVVKSSHIAGVHKSELNRPDDDQPQAIAPHNFLGP